ncbi:hypothetical protein HOLleu_36795 [Holothuria leucospilota]|uniref:Uncharacterized protein n=1 Tax=Holothuria leucospilota TaxID=206669 RepID=A0A9Q0YKC0_HOLLE|nr:hypothetical protein HOLleu_36795 [Holothuria leucospilota]
MAATPHRNRRAYSETSPNLTNFGTETGSQQRSFSTSDISPERLEEGSVFDFSPLPTDLPETSQTDSEMTFEGRDQVPVRDDSCSQQIPVEVSDFIIRRQIESETNSLGTLTETESVATRIRTDLHIDTHMHDFSDFLDEFLEFELNHRNCNGSEPTAREGTTSMDRPVLGSMQNTTSDSLQATQTGEPSNGSCLYAANTTSVHEAWSTQTPVLYTSSELGFDYHSHLSSNHSNTSNARCDGFQAPSLVGPTFTSALDLSNIATTSYSKSTIAINSGNISPSSTATYSLSQRSPRAQTTSQSMTYPTSWDTGQRSQCLLPVQNVQRDPSCTTDSSSNRTNLDKEGGTKDPQSENAIAHPTGARKKRAVRKDKWSSKSSATGTEKSLPNGKLRSMNIVNFFATGYVKSMHIHSATYYCYLLYIKPHFVRS